MKILCSRMYCFGNTFDEFIRCLEDKTGILINRRFKKGNYSKFISGYKAGEPYEVIVRKSDKGYYCQESDIYEVDDEDI